MHASQETRRILPLALSAITFVVALVSGGQSESVAQVPLPSSPLEGPSVTRPALPPFESERPSPPPPMPVLPTPERRGRLYDEPLVFVREVRLIGNTAFSTAELEPVLAPFVGRTVTAGELLQLRDRLTNFYIERGYVNSGALIPDQNIENGVVEIQIVEGRLAEIAILGLESLDPAFVEDRIALGMGPPLNVNQLRERIQLLLLDRAIERLDARLGPGLEPGEGRLEVDVEEAPRYQSRARIANDRAPSIGGTRGEVSFEFGNMLGFGDPLVVDLSVAEGLQELEFSYDVPVTATDLSLFVSGQIADFQVVEEPLNILDIEGSSRSILGGITVPVLRSLDNEVLLQPFLERRRTTTSVEGRRFSFSPGARNGQTDVTALRFAQQWLNRSRAEALALRSTFSLGLDLLGSTVNRTAPDSQFFAWLGQGQWARRLNDANWQVRLRGDLQLTPDPLLPVERIALGGSSTVRGYRQNQLVVDNGWDASAELHIPLGRVPSTKAERDLGPVTLTAFVDTGGGWNVDDPGPDPAFLAGIGAGINWQPTQHIDLRFEGAVPLNNAPDPVDNSLQDLAIYFDVRVLLF